MLNESASPSTSTRQNFSCFSIWSMLLPCVSSGFFTWPFSTFAARRSKNNIAWHNKQENICLKSINQLVSWLKPSCWILHFRNLLLLPPSPQPDIRRRTSAHRSEIILELSNLAVKAPEEEQLEIADPFPAQKRPANILAYPYAPELQNTGFWVSHLQRMRWNM